LKQWYPVSTSLTVYRKQITAKKKADKQTTTKQAEMSVVYATKKWQDCFSIWRQTNL